MTEIKPCPWCGKDNTHLKIYTNDACHICCMWCDAESSYHDSAAKAIHEWNRVSDAVRRSSDRFADIDYSQYTPFVQLTSGDLIVFQAQLKTEEDTVWIVPKSIAITQEKAYLLDKNGNVIASLKLSPVQGGFVREGDTVTFKKSIFKKLLGVFEGLT